MSRYAIKFPFRVRIHGGEFDESARAIHREDGLKTIQAELGIVLESTIERKQMSTKTTFKRIALVTVAALGFGVMSVAPSNAAADSMTLGAATSSATIGVAVTNTVTLSAIAAAGSEVLTATVALISAPSTSSAAGVLPAVTVGASAGTNADSATITGGFSATSKAAGRFTAAGTISVTADVAGTYVYSITPGVTALNKTAQTWTVTVAARTGVTAAGSTVLNNYAYYGDPVNVGIRGAWQLWSDTTNALTLNAYANPSDAASAAIKVTQGNGLTGAAALTAGEASALTVSVTGPAVVAISGEGEGYSSNLGARGIYAISTAGQLAALGLTQYVYVFSTGAPGLATVSIKAGSVDLGSRKIQFYGQAASITPTVAKAVIGKTATEAVITAIVKDESGNVVPNATVYAVSDTVATISNSYTSCGASDKDGKVSCSLTGVAAGTAKVTLTLNSASTGTSAVSAAPVSVRVSDGVATKVSYAFDKATYYPGEAAVITATVSNAEGVMPAGSWAVLSAAVAGNYTLANTPGTSVVTTDATGTLKYNTTVPVGISGALTLTGTAATGITATFGSAEVVNAALTAAQEATDAANEATDAGNNAKDAADQAIEAADAATIAAQDAAAAAEAAGEMAVEAAEAAGAIAQDALDAANAATDAALSAAEAADAATAAATEAKESADAATAAVAELSAEVAKLMAALNAKITTLANVVAKIAKKVKA
jgi:hypothetical protein